MHDLLRPLVVHLPALRKNENIRSVLCVGYYVFILQNYSNLVLPLHAKSLKVRSSVSGGVVNRKSKLDPLTIKASTTAGGARYGPLAIASRVTRDSNCTARELRALTYAEGLASKFYEMEASCYEQLSHGEPSNLSSDAQIIQVLVRYISHFRLTRRHTSPNA